MLIAYLAERDERPGASARGLTTAEWGLAGHGNFRKSWYEDGNPLVWTVCGREPWLVWAGGTTHYRGLVTTARNGTREERAPGICCIMFMLTGLIVAVCLVLPGVVCTSGHRTGLELGARPVEMVICCGRWLDRARNFAWR